MCEKLLVKVPRYVHRTLVTKQLIYFKVIPMAMPKPPLPSTRSTLLAGTKD